MGIKILVLDDDEIRLKAFSKKYGSEARVALASDFPAFKRFLVEEGPWDIVFLDHDLGLTAIDDACFKTVHGCQEPYNGKDAVNLLVDVADPNRTEVFVHSWNIGEAIRMTELLDEAGFACHRVPFDANRLPTLHDFV
jgi:hypothetical protein